MRVLFVGFVWPEPKSSAAGQNILSYVRACISEKWQVWFCSAAEKGNQSANLTRLGVVEFDAKLNDSHFNASIREISPDIVIFDRFLSFEQFAWRVKAECENALLVLDAEDLHFLRTARHQFIKYNPVSTSIPSASSILEVQHKPFLYNDLSFRELACIYQADLTLVLSQAEQYLLIDSFNVPENQVIHLPFIVQQPNDNALSFSDRKDFVFIGNFRHAPNYHAVKVLRENIWPKLLKRLSKNSDDNTIACHVYGAYLSPKAKQLENIAMNFFVHGFAQDQHEVIGKARVMLAPISFGAGVKGKLLDAMLCHTPCVTTTIGAEGIIEDISMANSTPLWAGSVEDNIDAFIDAAISLYCDETQWDCANNNGSQILNTRFDAETNHQAFIVALKENHAKLAEKRQSNFLQKMLARRQFQSNKYMSQWIEAKNQ